MDRKIPSTILATFCPSKCLNGIAAFHCICLHILRQALCIFDCTTKLFSNSCEDCLLTSSLCAVADTHPKLCACCKYTAPSLLSTATGQPKLLCAYCKYTAPSFVSVAHTQPQLLCACCKYTAPSLVSAAHTQP